MRSDLGPVEHGQVLCCDEVSPVRGHKLPDVFDAELVKAGEDGRGGQGWPGEGR